MAAPPQQAASPQLQQFILQEQAKAQVSVPTRALASHRSLCAEKT
jgi:hypothetical protein